MQNRAPRPKFLDLRRIHLPVTGVLSISHRITGLLLFLIMPLAVWLLEISLRDRAGFEQAQILLHGPLGKVFLLLLLWWFLHHLIAGIRFLLIDMDVGVEIGRARRSATAVFFLSLMVLAFLVGWLL